MFSFLATSDLHEDDRPRNEYRWEIFPWLLRHAQNRKVPYIFLLGDLTDQKDHHSNALVNRLADNIRTLARHVTVVVLKGNHDYLNPDVPLLRFLQNTSGIHVIVEPTELELAGKKLLFLPHTRSHLHWRNVVSLKGHDFIFLHQTLRGSVTSNGFDMGGIAPGYFSKSRIGKKTIVLSGDIHVPQRVGNLTYCGSPHPVHFGDTFRPRVLYWDGTQLKSIPRTTIKKAVVDIREPKELEEARWSTGDQLRIILHIPRSRFVDWPDLTREVRRIAKKLEVEVHGLELREEKATRRVRIGVQHEDAITAPPVELLESFCSNNQLDPKLRKRGLKLVGQVLDGSAA